MTDRLALLRDGASIRPMAWAAVVDREPVLFRERGRAEDYAARHDGLLVPLCDARAAQQLLESLRQAQEELALCRQRVLDDRVRLAGG